MPSKLPTRKKPSNRGRGYTIHERGYIRITRGRHRHKYLHRLLAAKRLRRELSKDEQVHHHDGNKVNNHKGNFDILGERVHGWVSARQAFWVGKVLNLKELKQYEEFYGEPAPDYVREFARENPIRV